MAFAKNKLCGTEKKGHVQNRSAQSAPLYQQGVAKMATRFVHHSLVPPCYIIFLHLCDVAVLQSTFSSSDHFPVSFSFRSVVSDTDSHSQLSLSFLNYARADYLGMCDYLLDWDFDPVCPHGMLNSFGPISNRQSLLLLTSLFPLLLSRVVTLISLVGLMVRFVIILTA